MQICMEKEEINLITGDCLTFNATPQNMQDI